MSPCVALFALRWEKLPVDRRRRKPLRRSPRKLTLSESPFQAPQFHRGAFLFAWPALLAGRVFCLRRVCGSAFVSQEPRIFVTIPKLLRSVIAETHGGEKDVKQERAEKCSEKESAQVQAHRFETIGRIAPGAAGIWHPRRDDSGDRERAEGSSRAWR